MNVLFLMLAFPDMNKSFNMFTSIVQEFSRNGHSIYVVAPGSEGTSTSIKRESGIDVLRVNTLPLKNIPNYLKGIANILLPYQFHRALRKFYPNVHFDLIVSPTPPVSLADLVVKLKNRHGALFYLILRDIFPQNAVDLKFMKKGSLVYTYFKAKEKKLYRAADQIGCMSPANIDYLITHNNIDACKLHVLENYQKLYCEYGIHQEYIRHQYGLKGKFVIVFGGNMGKPQQIENVLTLAKNCRKYDDVVFLLLGEGIQRKSIEAQIKDERLENVWMMDTIPKQLYQKLISVCDIGLISLHEDFTIPNIPSKTLDYFNVGIPVLASIDRASDYGALLEGSDAGLWSYSGDHDAFKSNFDRLYFDSSLRKRMGNNGRKYFERNLTPDKAYKVIMNHISKDVLEKKRN